MLSKSIFLTLAFILSFSLRPAEAASYETCRKSYGQLMAKSARRAKVHTAAGIATSFAGGLPLGFAAGYALDRIAGNVVTMSGRRIAGIAGVGVSLTGLSAFEIFHLIAVIQERAAFAEVVAHAMDESERHSLGPATYALSEFLLKTFGVVGARGTNSIYPAFTLPKAELTGQFHLSKINLPVGELVQGALRWMGQIGALCYADDSALAADEFTRRFGYALNVITNSRQP